MPRPNFISNEDIIRWSRSIDLDKSLPSEMSKSAVIREVCFAGLWLTEELFKLNCPEIIVARIQWTAGKLSYGRDPWEIHQQILEEYNNNTLVFEAEPIEDLN
jgi:hypothetical protein